MCICANTHYYRMFVPCICPNFGGKTEQSGASKYLHQFRVGVQLGPRKHPQDNLLGCPEPGRLNNII